jgi:hypothetical protein
LKSLKLCRKLVVVVLRRLQIVTLYTACTPRTGMRKSPPSSKATKSREGKGQISRPAVGAMP